MNKQDTKEERINWKPGNMLYPLPVVMVSCTDGKGNDNIVTVAWTGTICSDPAMLYISVRKERYSYKMIKDTGEFVVNLTTKSLARACDYCGVHSGRDEDKFRSLRLHKVPSVKVKAPSIKESPVSIECRVNKIIELGSHDMFIAEVVNVSVDSKYMSGQKFNLFRAEPIVYSHGSYYDLAGEIGRFGYSVKKSK